MTSSPTSCTVRASYSTPPTSFVAFCFSNEKLLFRYPLDNPFLVHSPSATPALLRPATAASTAALSSVALQPANLNLFRPSLIPAASHADPSQTYGSEVARPVEGEAAEEVRAPSPPRRSLGSASPVSQHLQFPASGAHRSLIGAPRPHFRLTKSTATLSEHSITAAESVGPPSHKAALSSTCFVSADSAKSTAQSLLMRRNWRRHRQEPRTASPHPSSTLDITATDLGYDEFEADALKKDFWESSMLQNCVGLPSIALAHLIRSVRTTTTVQVDNVVFFVFPLPLLPSSASGGAATGGSDRQADSKPPLLGTLPLPKFPSVVSSQGKFDTIGSFNSSTILSWCPQSNTFRGTSSSRQLFSSSPLQDPPPAVLVVATTAMDTDNGKLLRFLQCYVNLWLREERRERYVSSQLQCLREVISRWKQEERLFSGGYPTAEANGFGEEERRVPTKATASYQQHSTPARASASSPKAKATESKRLSTAEARLPHSPSRLSGPPRAFPTRQPLSPSPSSHSSSWSDTISVSSKTASSRSHSAGSSEAGEAWNTEERQPAMVMAARLSSPLRTVHVVPESNGESMRAVFVPSLRPSEPAASYTMTAMKNRGRKGTHRHSGRAGPVSLLDVLLTAPQLTLPKELVALVDAIDYWQRELRPIRSISQRRLHLLHSRGNHDCPCPPYLTVAQVLQLPLAHLVDIPPSTSHTLFTSTPLATPALDPRGAVQQIAGTSPALLEAYAALVGAPFSDLLPVGEALRCLEVLKEPRTVGALRRVWQQLLLHHIAARRVPAAEAGSVPHPLRFQPGSASWYAALQLSQPALHRIIMEEAVNTDFLPMALLELLRTRHVVRIDSVISVVFTHASITPCAPMQRRFKKQLRRWEGMKKDAAAEAVPHSAEPVAARPSGLPRLAAPTLLLLQLHMEIPSTVPLDTPPTQARYDAYDRSAASAYRRQLLLLHGGIAYKDNSTTSLSTTRDPSCLLPLSVACVWGPACPICVELLSSMNSWKLPVRYPKSSVAVYFDLRFHSLDPVFIVDHTGVKASRLSSTAVSPLSTAAESKEAMAEVDYPQCVKEQDRVRDGKWRHNEQWLDEGKQWSLKPSLRAVTTQNFHDSPFKVYQRLCRWQEKASETGTTSAGSPNDSAVEEVGTEEGAVLGHPALKPATTSLPSAILSERSPLTAASIPAKAVAYLAAMAPVIQERLESSAVSSAAIIALAEQLLPSKESTGSSLEESRPSTPPLVETPQPISPSLRYTRRHRPDRTAQLQKILSSHSGFNLPPPPDGIPMGGPISGALEASSTVPVLVLLQCVVHHLIALLWWKEDTREETKEAYREGHEKLEPHPAAVEEGEVIHYLRRYLYSLSSFLNHLNDVHAYVQRLKSSSAPSSHTLFMDQEEGETAEVIAMEAKLPPLSSAAMRVHIEPYKLYERLGLLPILLPYAAGNMKSAPSTSASGSDSESSTIQTYSSATPPIPLLLHAAVNEFSDVFVI